jgi:hypothetical protein
LVEMSPVIRMEMEIQIAKIGGFSKLEHSNL